LAIDNGYDQPHHAIAAACFFSLFGVLNHKYIHHGFPGDLAQGKKHRRPLTSMYYRAEIESRVSGNGIVARGFVKERSNRNEYSNGGKDNARNARITKYKYQPRQETDG
jgi:hypothetical protein